MSLWFDRATLQGDVGHYVRILVDVDLSSELPDFIYLDVDGQDIEIELSYESLPTFCTTCMSIGHDLIMCRLVGRNRVKEVTNEEVKSPPKEVKQVYSERSEASLCS